MFSFSRLLTTLKEVHVTYGLLWRVKTFSKWFRDQGTRFVDTLLHFGGFQIDDNRIVNMPKMSKCSWFVDLL